AFDTLYAEGQRRYTETLPPYMRSMIQQLPKPKVESIDGLAPSIALEQKRGGLNPRSTVGTMTEIYDLLRLFYSHLGDPFCPETGDPICQISKPFIVSKLLTLSQKKIAILTPITLEKKDNFQEWADRFNAQGFLRIRLDGTYYTLDEKIPFEKGRKQELLLVIDRLVIGPKNEERLYEAIDKAAKISQGIVIIAQEEGEDLFFNLQFAVEKTGKSYPPITPQTFSFNHQEGMCLECQGLGLVYGFAWSAHPKLMDLSLSELCVHLFGEKGSSSPLNILEKYWKELGVNPHTPLNQLSSKEFDWIFHGAPEQEIKKLATLKWVGLSSLFGSIARMGKKQNKEHLLPLMATSPCPTCQGARLNPLARHVQLQGVTLPILCAKELDTLLPFFHSLSLQKTPFLQEAHRQICSTLELLLSLGLSYLSLDRSAPTLSGGELQRIRLAKQLGTGLTSCLYVLDEPTIGLHPYNNEQLNSALKALSQFNNTLVLVEHDPMTIQIADHIVDFGPKAGKEGGKICAQGSYLEILQNKDSLTGNYLSGRKTIPFPPKRRPFSPDLRIEGAKLHTLQNLFLAIPKGAITCLTGISGSGKSTLLRYLLKPAAEKAFHQRKPPDEIEYEGTTFRGLSQFEKVVTIDQSPFGQTSRADVNSFTEIAPLIRAHFVQLPLAKAKGLQGKHFSPNHLRGMCRTCWGLGYKSVDLQFLPPVRVQCDSCRGFRLNPVSLDVRYKGKHLGDFFACTIQEALSFFQDIPKIAKRLQLLQEVGLSYLTLGQEIASLSGGELQRLRLSKELAKKENGKTLYLIDEPTVGLHFDDIAKLLPIFHRLADRKNTLIIIEHNIDLIVNADYIIDLGPGAGPKGGAIV
ncbi:MAG: excinuclease ABC subunit UvrA, partial [Chlamydiia bacterium]|nr:excinuclease ABC subunit UvrA [Chlamydiia bacterium]